MLPASHFLLGGYISSVMAVCGTVLNLLALWVLVDKKLRSNPTTILVTKLQNVTDNSVSKSGKNIDTFNGSKSCHFSVLSM